MTDERAGPERLACGACAAPNDPAAERCGGCGVSLVLAALHVAGGPVLALKPRSYVLGRAPEADFVLLDISVSRRHARLDYDAGFVITDLGSRHGVLVDGRPVRAARLRGGALVRLGNVVLRYAEADPGAETGDLGWLPDPAWRLTATEARLAWLLAEGHTLQSAAGQLGVTHGTVRTHLKRVFSKTGTSRQAELVALVLGGPAGRQD